jgi:hypothetical protein
MVRLAVLSLLSLSLLAGTASAAPPDAAKLRAAGVKVSWPVTGTATMAPGQVVEVRVTSRRTRSEVSLARVGARDRVMRIIARKTLRSGSFRAVLPAAASGARYALRLRVAGHDYQSVIVTPRPAVPAPAPPPATSVLAAAPQGPCDVGSGGPQTTVGPAVRGAGERLTIELLNRGPGCLGIPVTMTVAWERLTADGVWQAVPRGCFGYGPPEDDRSGCVGLPSFAVVAPGETHRTWVDVPTDFEPGRYRLSASVPGVSGWEFTVLPTM